LPHCPIFSSKPVNSPSEKIKKITVMIVAMILSIEKYLKEDTKCPVLLVRVYKSILK